MIFDSPLADMQIRGNIFAGLAQENPLHDVMLARSKARETLFGCFMQPEHLEDQFVSFAGDVAIGVPRCGRLLFGHSRKDSVGIIFGVRN